MAVPFCDVGPLGWVQGGAQAAEAGIKCHSFRIVSPDRPTVRSRPSDIVQGAGSHVEAGCSLGIPGSDDEQQTSWFFWTVIRSITAALPVSVSLLPVRHSGGHLCSSASDGDHHHAEAPPPGSIAVFCQVVVMLALAPPSGHPVHH